MRTCELFIGSKFIGANVSDSEFMYKRLLLRVRSCNSYNITIDNYFALLILIK